ncbi:hypothetical protein HYV43_05230 [Candidatus Micrarchaeota archaeon]|nr:hypothetical protein [Candidatus Micrarchaeota archaeon]
MQQKRPTRVAFFCDLGIRASENVHRAALDLIQSQGMDNIRLYHGGLYDETAKHSGTYHLSQGRTSERLHLSEIDVIVPLTVDTQQIMRARLRLLEGHDKPRLIPIHEHQIKPDNINPALLLQLLRMLAQDEDPHGTREKRV